MKFICLQENNYDCGLACIKMMLAHYHNNKKFLQLDKEIVNARYSFLQMKNYASKYNLFTEGIEFEEKELLFNYPNSICQVHRNNKNHFVIFEKKRNNFIYLIDPEFGRIKLTNEEFFNIFTGNALIKKERKEYILPKEKRVNENLNYILVYIIFLIIDFGSLFIISYLGNNSKYLFHNFLMICVIVLSLIGKIRLVNRHLAMMDINIKNILQGDKKLFASTKKGLLSYKVYSVKYLYGLINSIFILFFITFILFLNGFYNILLILILMIFSYLISNFNLIKDNTAIYHITTKEEEFLSTSNIDAYDELINKSKIFTSSKSVSMILYQVIIMCGIMVINNVEEINSFQFIVFNTFYYLILINKFNYLFKESKLLYFEYKKYASTYNYLLKCINKEPKIIENQ